MIETRRRIGGLGGWLHVYQGLLVFVPTKPTRRLLKSVRLALGVAARRDLRQTLLAAGFDRARSDRACPEEESNLYAPKGRRV